MVIHGMISGPREVNQIKIGRLVPVKKDGKTITDKNGKPKMRPEMTKFFTIATTGRDKNENLIADGDLMTKALMLQYKEWNGKGDKPGPLTQIPIMFQAHDPELNWRTELNYYTASGRKCWGDNRNALRIFEETAPGTPKVDGKNHIVRVDRHEVPCDMETCLYYQQRLCRKTGVLTCFFPFDERGYMSTCVRWRTTSTWMIGWMDNAIHRMWSLCAGRMAHIEVLLVMRPQRIEIPDVGPQVKHLVCLEPRQQKIEEFRQYLLAVREQEGAAVNQIMEWERTHRTLLLTSGLEGEGTTAAHIAKEFYGQDEEEDDGKEDKQRKKGKEEKGVSKQPEASTPEAAAPKNEGDPFPPVDPTLSEPQRELLPPSEKREPLSDEQFRQEVVSPLPEEGEEPPAEEAPSLEAQAEVQAGAKAPEVYTEEFFAARQTRWLKIRSKPGFYINTKYGEEVKIGDPINKEWEDEV